MANNRINNNPFFSTGDPKTSVETTLYENNRPGDFGTVCWFQGKRYQKVILESASTATPAVKAPIFWKSGVSGSWIATFDVADSEGGLNQCAGTLETGATVPAVSQYFWVLQEAELLTVNGAALNFSSLGIIWPTAAGGGTFSFTAAGTAAVYASCGTVHTTNNLSGGAGDLVVDFCVPSKA